MGTILIYIFLVHNYTTQINDTIPKSHLDSAFIDWNKATFESLNRQLQLSTDSIPKSRYENRVEAVKAYWKIKSLNDVNHESIRYKLLKTLKQESFTKKNVAYIIEANESGVKVMLSSYVVYPNENNIADIELFEFVNDTWKKIGQFKQEKFKIQADLRIYISPFRKGDNYDDIVITEFRNGKTKQSEYFLYSTLLKDTTLRKLLPE